MEKRFRQRLRESGGRHFHPAAAFLLAVWLVHALLRAAVLLRKDPFGFAFVNKPDWYIFHAFAIAALWILGYSLPFLLALILAGAWDKPRLARWTFALLGIFHSLILGFTVADHEMMRFMGLHLDPSLLGTYGNPAAFREVAKFVAS